MPARDQTARLLRNGDLATLRLSGDLDGSAQAGLDAVSDALAAEPPGRLLLDFAEVSYINSTGLALIVGLLARARAAGVPVAACGLTPHYLEIFEITRLSDFIDIYPDEAVTRGDLPASA